MQYVDIAQVILVSQEAIAETEESLERTRDSLERSRALLQTRRSTDLHLKPAKPAHRKPADRVPHRDVKH